MAADIQKATEHALNIFMYSGFYTLYTQKLPSLSGFMLILALLDIF